MLAWRGFEEYSDKFPIGYRGLVKIVVSFVADCRETVFVEDPYIVFHFVADSYS